MPKSVPNTAPLTLNISELTHATPTFAYASGKAVVTLRALYNLTSNFLAPPFLLEKYALFKSNNETACAFHSDFGSKPISDLCVSIF